MTIKSTLMAGAIVLGATVFVGPSAFAKEKPVEIEVKAGDTLTLIAEANKSTVERVFNANESLANPDAIDVGMKLRIPTDDEKLTDRYSSYLATAAAAAPVVAQTTSTYTTRSYSSAPVNGNSYYVGNGMWCTDYVHSKRPDIPVYGNAGYNWISAAQSQGKATGTEARAGAVAVQNGHVAYVDRVNADGTYTVSEMGWNYRAGNYNQRTVKPGEFGQFIY